MTANTENRPFIDPIAFAAALVLAPATVTTMSFMLVIPLFALAFGALPYLIFGTPVFLWMVTRFPVRFSTFALGGLMAHVLFVVCYALYANASPDPDTYLLGFYALWGIPFAMLWGGAFALFYQGFYRPLVT